ncbi:hypothetical protein ACFVSU_00300 [Microbacterium sp. NPDC058062]|uniref:hypothetical protein n=1 Tax=Microbacterium sp. NPDC058062 TaxID=3346320 RepID=UPI0036DB84F5
MFFLRWIPTFLAFPLGESIASAVLGTHRSPLTALAAGAIGGGVVGAAQWLALGRLVDWRWAVWTLGATGAGCALSLVWFGPAVTPAAVAATGLITGGMVGVAQGSLLRRRWRIALAWAATVSLAWGTAGLVGTLDGARTVLGSNGALGATVVTGVVLWLVLRHRLIRRPVPPAESTRTMDLAASIIEARREVNRRHR